MTYARPAVALMQPTFLPWQGYFALIDSVDVFVFLDDFQFCRRSFMHRNRLFLAPGGNAGWVTIPVEHAGSDARGALNQVRPIIDAALQRKLLTMLRHAYGATPFYARFAPELEAWLTGPPADLASFNIAFIRMAAGWLGLRAELRRSSEVGSEGRRSARLADLLRRLHARTYLSARGSFGYMVEDRVFPLDDVEARFQIFEPQRYAQKQSAEFVPYLSVLDAILQLGPEGALQVIRAGQQRFASWHDMLAGSLPEQAITDDQSH